MKNFNLGKNNPETGIELQLSNINKSINLDSKDILLSFNKIFTIMTAMFKMRLLN